MVTSKQIIKGAAAWIDSELLTTMHGLPQYGVGVAAALLSKPAEAKLEQLRQSKEAQAMGILQDGGFDYDRLREALVGPFPEEGLRLEADQINNFVNKFLGKLGPILNFQVQGGVTFHRADLEKLLDYIKEA